MRKRPWGWHWGQIHSHHLARIWIQSDYAHTVISSVRIFVPLQNSLLIVIGIVPVEQFVDRGERHSVAYLCAYLCDGTVVDAIYDVGSEPARDESGKRDGGCKDDGD
jgi:hypothetical protein